MKNIKYVFWEDDGVWIGYLEEFPDYWTQGETLDALKENLKEIYHDLVSDAIPNIRRVDELEVA